MNSPAGNGADNETSFIRRYMELTGTSEAGARSVFMYAGPPDNHEDGIVRQVNGAPAPHPGMGKMHRTESSDKPQH